MQKIAQGIVLSASDRKEKDKWIKLYTLEYGKIMALLKGVKNANAKLKFASQPFCFAEFCIEDKNVITQADLKESFCDLSLDYDRYLIGCKMLRLIDDLTLFDSVENPNLFLTLLKSLNLLTNYQNLSEKLIFAKFLVEVLSNLGYKLNLNNCANCGSTMLTNCFYDFSINGIVCVGCKSAYSIKIEKEVYVALKSLVSIDFSNITNLKISDITLKIGTNFLSKVYSEHFNKKFEFFIVLYAYFQSTWN